MIEAIFDRFTDYCYNNIKVNKRGVMWDVGIDSNKGQA